MAAVKQIEGLPVIDAKRQLTVTVTKRDIARGVKMTPDKCAMARACYRELNCLEVRVYRTRCYIRTNDHNWVRYITPRSLRDETIAYDRGGRMMPGMHTLTPPTGTYKLGQPHRGGKPTGKGNRRKYVLTHVRASAG